MSDEITQKTPTPSPPDHMEERVFSLRYNTDIAIRYHNRRIHFLDRWHKFTSVVTLFLSSAAVATLIGQDSRLLPGVIGAIAAFTQALDMVFKVKETSDIHREIRNKYLALYLKIETAGLLTEQKMNELIADRYAIEMQEPPILQAVLAISTNESFRYFGCSKEDNPGSYIENIAWYHRAFPHLSWDI